MGMPIKPPEMRQRRNKPVTSAVLPTPEEAARNAKVPPLPNRGPGKAWHKRTREWWEAVWKSPIATKYLDVHCQGLYALAELKDDRFKMTGRDPDRLKFDAEIRQLSREFWLFPADMARMGWTIAAPEKVEAKPAPVEAPAEDPRKLLRMVQ